MRTLEWLLWLRIGPSGMLLRTIYWTSVFLEVLRISWVAEQPLASQKGLSSMQQFLRQYRTDPSALLIADTIVRYSADRYKPWQQKHPSGRIGYRENTTAMFSISVFDHGGFYSPWNAVVELICYTSHRNEGNLSKQAIAGCWNTCSVTDNTRRRSVACYRAEQIG